MKKTERKKQLRERIIVGAVIIAMNLVWILPTGTKIYANYKEGNYIKYWPKPRIYAKAVVVVPESDYSILIPMGEFMITAYCLCDLCCEVWADKRPTDEEGNPIVIGAAGSILEAGKSIAVDPTVIPYGTKVLINGVEYIAEDCGGDVKGNWIDIYMEDHERAREHGVKYAEVYIVYDSNAGT